MKVNVHGLIPMYNIMSQNHSTVCLAGFVVKYQKEATRHKRRLFLAMLNCQMTKLVKLLGQTSQYTLYSDQTHWTLMLLWWHHHLCPLFACTIYHHLREGQYQTSRGQSQTHRLATYLLSQMYWVDSTILYHWCTPFNKWKTNGAKTFILILFIKLRNQLISFLQEGFVLI